MEKKEPMSLDKRLEIGLRAHDARDRGDEGEYLRIMMEEYPLPPYLAKWAKKRLGAEYLRERHYNLEEANAEFGPGWLDR